jgi:predicted DCC family thiol-disulfide oxidoreductase YuxK
MQPTPALLVTDGDCGFCQSSAAWLLRNFPGNWQNAPSQSLQIADYDLTQSDIETQVWFVQTNEAGVVKFGGAQAVAKLLLTQPKFWIKPLAALAFVPVFKQIANLLYKLISRNRGRLPGATDACAVEPTKE